MGSHLSVGAGRKSTDAKSLFFKVESGKSPSSAQNRKPRATLTSRQMPGPLAAGAYWASQQKKVASLEEKKTFGILMYICIRTMAPYGSKPHLHCTLVM